MSFEIAPFTSSDAWEKFISEHSPQSLFQSWLYGVVQEKLGARLWRFGVYHDQELVAIFSVIYVHAKRGSYLHVRHGPVISSQMGHVWEPIIEQLKTMAKAENAWFIRISPLIDDLHELQIKALGFQPSPVHEVDAEYCWVLGLDNSEEQLLANMRKTTRYEIRRAQKIGIKIEKSEKVSDLKAFHGLYKKTSERHGFVPHRGIDTEFEVFAKEGKAILLTGSYQGEILASAIILFYGNQAIYHHSASVPTSIPVNYLIQWEVIREAKRRGFALYNFWGIAPEGNPRHPWQGLTLFKKGFGGRPVKYLHAHDLPTSPFYRVTQALEMVRRIIKGY